MPIIQTVGVSDIYPYDTNVSIAEVQVTIKVRYGELKHH